MAHFTFATQATVKKKTRTRKTIFFSEAETSVLQDEEEKNYGAINDKFSSAVDNKRRMAVCTKNSMMVFALDVVHRSIDLQRSVKTSGATPREGFY